MRDNLRHWTRLKYHDPAEVLRALHTAEIALSPLDLPSRVRRLRTNQLNKYREWRDAALFTYGLGVAYGSPVYYATEERQDYDFVACWADKEAQHFTPVQLKEWVPADLNPNGTLEDLLGGLTPVASTQTVLAVRLNREERVDFDRLTLPHLPWAQLWFFGATSPDETRWSIWGDMLNTPCRVDFDYPR